MNVCMNVCICNAAREPPSPPPFLSQSLCERASDTVATCSLTSCLFPTACFVVRCPMCPLFHSHHHQRGGYPSFLPILRNPYRTGYVVVWGGGKGQGLYYRTNRSLFIYIHIPTHSLHPAPSPLPSPFDVAFFSSDACMSRRSILTDYVFGLCFLLSSSSYRM